MKRKPTNCKCGNFRDAGSRWVVIERRPAPKSSRLKCLECGWRWYNSCRYVSKLRDHKERDRKGMTDELILSRLKEGTLTVDLETAEVQSYHPRLKAWRVLRAESRTSNGSTYSFIPISYQGRKKKIALHRLVWMASTLKVVPAGFDVDHVNGKRGEFPDRLENLRLLESSVNRGLGCPSESMSLFDESEPF